MSFVSVHISFKDRDMSSPLVSIVYKEAAVYIYFMFSSEWETRSLIYITSRRWLSRVCMDAWLLLVYSLCIDLYELCSLSYTLLKPKRHSLRCHGFVVHALLLRMHTNVVDFRVMRRLPSRMKLTMNWRCVNQHSWDPWQRTTWSRRVTSDFNSVFI